MSALISRINSNWSDRSQQEEDYQKITLPDGLMSSALVIPVAFPARKNAIDILLLKTMTYASVFFVQILEWVCIAHVFNCFHEQVDSLSPTENIQVNTVIRRALILLWTAVCYEDITDIYEIIVWVIYVRRDPEKHGFTLMIDGNEKNEIGNKFKALGSIWAFGSIFCIVIPKILIIVSLWWIGSAWLVNTVRSDIEKIFADSLTLVFVRDIGGLVLHIIFPVSFQESCVHCKPSIRFPKQNHWQAVITTALRWAIVLAATTFVDQYFTSKFKLDQTLDKYYAMNKFKLIFSYFGLAGNFKK